MTRSEARCEAFKLIFQITAHKEQYPEVVELFEEQNSDLKKSDKKQYLYIASTARGVFDNVEKLDDEIEKNLADGWKIGRLSKVSLAILRLSIYEIIYLDDVPDKVAINEAVNLAKEYDEDSGASFVNGVLSNIIR